MPFYFSNLILQFAFLITKEIINIKDFTFACWFVCQVIQP